MVLEVGDLSRSAKLVTLADNGYGVTLLLVQRALSPYSNEMGGASQCVCDISLEQSSN